MHINLRRAVVIRVSGLPIQYVSEDFSMPRIDICRWC